MKTEEKLKAMGDIDPEYIESAAKLRNRRRPFVKIAMAAAALLVAGCGTFLAMRALHNDKSGEMTASLPDHASEQTEVPPETGKAQQTDPPVIVPVSDLPESVRAVFASVPDTPKKYGAPGYYDYVQELRRSRFYAGEPLAGFYGRTAAEFLLSGEKNENAAYSPFNVYMALAMMAETASGETRAQILDLLGADSIDALREQANDLFISNYFDNDAMTSLPAASLWINSGVYPYLKQDTLKTLAYDYHSSSFTGDMRDPEFTKLCRKWLNEQTHGLLNDQANELELKPEEMMHIITTLYFKGCWMNKFNEAANTVEAFRSPTGDEQVTFMHGGADAYYELNGFSMVRKDLNEYANVWLVLPDEGTALEDVIRDGSALGAVLGGAEGAQVGGAIIHLNMPKFDVESKLDLIKGLEKLGVTDCFDPTKADFTELTDLEGVYISSVNHGVRVVLDETGVEAAAYTDIGYAGSSMPTREVDFTLDRPFMFVITGMDGTPLFVGTVYHPVS